MPKIKKKTQYRKSEILNSFISIAYSNKTLGLLKSLKLEIF